MPGRHSLHKHKAEHAMTHTQIDAAPPVLGSKPSLTSFMTGLHGEVLLRGDPGYEQARRIWNGMIDRYPALIVRCTDTTDVIACVNFAREEGLPLAVRGGGHNVAGTALCEDGLVVDLSTMK